MWTRALLKNNAKQALLGRYWRAFAVCLVLSLLGVSTTSSSATLTFRSSVDRVEEMFSTPTWTGNVPQNAWQTYGESIPAPLLGVVGVAALIGLVIALCWMIFLVQPLAVARARYFMESRQGLTPFGTVLTVFRSGYLNVVAVQLLTSLKVALGLILIIPGVYWAFCYRQVPYLLAENPYLSASRAMQLSQEMMYGEKWNSFVLDLSFFGWQLLCTLTFGIGFFFLQPYMQATYAELYAALRSKAFAMGMADSSELGGFVRHDGGF